jgi:hypothetical protein
MADLFRMGPSNAVTKPYTDARAMRALDVVPRGSERWPCGSLWSSAAVGPPANGGTVLHNGAATP